jgi:predicted MarR family transcription regulator
VGKKQWVVACTEEAKKKLEGAHYLSLGKEGRIFPFTAPHGENVVKQELKLEVRDYCLMEERIGNLEEREKLMQARAMLIELQGVFEEAAEEEKGLESGECFELMNEVMEVLEVTG